MRLLLKLIAIPFMLITGILFLFCQFLLVASGILLGILSALVFLGALIMFLCEGVGSGIPFLVFSFLLSPYGLPKAAACMVGIIGGIHESLKDFISR